MFYIIIGIISGIILNLMPVFTPKGSIEIYPEWHCSLDSINNVQVSSNHASKMKLPVTTGSDIYLLSANGKLLNQKSIENRLASVSRSGEYCAQYDKAGTQAEFLSTRGEKFWRIISMEYPLLSSYGKIILLLNGDHSRIRIMDINGNPAGVKQIQGRLCITISFSKENDYSCIGFLDGSYYLLSDKGEILNNGHTPADSPVKGLAVSNNGNFSVVHYGNNKGDFLRLININGGKSYTIPLKNIHFTKTAISVTDKGNIAVIDYDRIIITRNNKIKTVLKIPPKTPGQSSIDFTGNLLSAGYTGTDGKTNFLIYLSDGTLLFHKVFNTESYIESRICENIIFLRGTANLFCYSFQIPDN